MNSVEFLDYIKKVKNRTVSIEKLMRRFSDSSKNNIYGVIFTLRKKGYKITSPSEGEYHLVELKPGDSPFKVNNVRMVQKVKKQVIEEKIEMEEVCQERVIPKLVDSDKEDYLKLMKQSFYYRLCAEALVKSNKYQELLRERLIDE